MKDKPVSHKNLNTFHFISFGEGIRDVSASLLQLTQEEDSFWGSFEKWLDRDHSLDYEEFRKEIGDEIETLNQILFRKDEIAKLLIKYLNKEDSLALPAILELTVALSKDLKEEVYPYFPQFFTAIVSHSTSQDVDLLEKLFQCLAGLFKVFWKYMVKDIYSVYELFSPLLSEKVERKGKGKKASSNKDHVKRLACEGFALLIRKVKTYDEFFKFLFKKLEENPERSSGVSRLLFETMRSSQNQFYFCSEPVVKSLLKLFGNDDLDSNLIENTLATMFQLMGEHAFPVIRAKKNKVDRDRLLVDNIFCDHIKSLISNLSDGANTQPLLHTLHLVLFWIKFKKEHSTAVEPKLIKILVTDVRQLSSKSDMDLDLMKAVAELMSTLILSDYLNSSPADIGAIITQMYSTSAEIAFLFTRNMFNYAMFAGKIFPHLLAFCLKKLQIQNNLHGGEILSILSETVIVLRPSIANAEDVKAYHESSFKLYFHSPAKMSSQNDKISSTKVLQDFILQTLSETEITDGNFHTIWSSLMCLPHLRFSTDEASAVTVTDSLSLKIQKTLLSSDGTLSQNAEKMGYLLCQVYFASLILKIDGQVSCFCDDFFLSLLKKYPSCVSILRLVDCYLSTSPRTTNGLDMVSALISNLNSPYHLVRKFSLRISKCLLANIKDADKILCAVDICLEAENLPCDVYSYRQKLVFLRKLELQFLPKDIPEEFEADLMKVAISYLLGMLFVNFKLLWNPTIQILDTFAKGQTKVFWEVFMPHLEDTIERCRKSVCTDRDAISEQTIDDDSVCMTAMRSFCRPVETPDVFNHRLLLLKAMELFPEVAEAKNKVVVPLIFQFMATEVANIDTDLAPTEAIDNPNSSCVQLEDSLLEEIVCKKLTTRTKRKKTMDISFKAKTLKSENQSLLESSLNDSQDQPIVVDLGSDSDDSEPEDENETVIEDENEIVIEDENEIVIEDENETVIEDENETVIEDENDDDNDEDDDGSSAALRPKKKSHTKKRFPITKTLAAYLSVFAKFRNPKGGYKSEELQLLYNELLCHHDPMIQKLAFDCLIPFNHKYITTYKENFYRILDNKTFKTEVVLFNLDAEKEIIQAEHRLQTLSVLMRILYGKMLHKTGNNTAGRNAANTRRSLVLRFLAGCNTEELRMFFELVFMPFKNLLIDETHITVEKIRNNLDLSSIIPIRKQHSTLSTLGQILQHLGNLVPDMQPYFLKVLLVITATSTTLLERRQEVLQQCVSILKSVRRLAVMKLIQFFKTFNDYQYTPEEVDGLFDSIVWPMIPNLEHDSANQPSPLLRLFCTWSENTRFFSLFGKHLVSNVSMTPLSQIMNLYASSRSKARVVGVVSTILFQLLTANEKSDEESKKNSPLVVNNGADFDGMDVDGDSLSLGHKLVLPFVDKILSRFQIMLTLLTKKRSRKSLPTRDLTILMRISKFVDSKQSAALIYLLPSFLMKPKMDPDCEVLILSTISNLVQACENPQQFIPLLSTFFGKLRNQNSRIGLVGVFQAIAKSGKLSENDSRAMQVFADIIAKLNAFNAEMLGEPDYDARVTGNKEALKLIQDNKTEIILLQAKIFILTWFYNIRLCNDTGLRNSSSFALQELSKAVVSHPACSPDIVKGVLFDSLLPEIQKGLKSPTEVVRHEVLEILSSVLEHWKEQSALKDLISLSNNDKDLDFWENIRHINLSHRARPLLRLAADLHHHKQNSTTLSTNTLMLYLLPIVQSFLLNPAYKNCVHVVDAAIAALGAIVALLPWHHYQPLLRRYLQMLCSNLEHQKTVIKIIVVFLNEFEIPEPTTTNASDLDEKTAIQPDPSVDVEACVSELPARDSVPKNTEKGRIYTDIRKNILPLLHRTFMRKSASDDAHKLGNKYYPENDEILRAPIALAMVKLLQKLPTNFLEKNLPGLFLRMCDLLKSRNESIRQKARETLVRMVSELGSKYFPSLLSEMKGVMKRGYQVHVLTYTLRAVMDEMNSKIKAGDLDVCVNDIIEICVTELFSDMAEEKEVEKITRKLKEARSEASPGILKVLATHVSGSCIQSIMDPFKEILSNRHNKKVLEKVEKCLQKLAEGLSKNNAAASDKLLIFIHSLLSQKMAVVSQKKPSILPNTAQKYERPDTFLVPKDPGRSGPPAKINPRTTDHILVEFALKLFHLSLKENKFGKDQKTLEMLDPFVSLFVESLSSNQIKTITESLHCLELLYKSHPLPSFEPLTRRVFTSLFTLVNRHSGAGMAQGENKRMVEKCFRLFTLLVRTSSYHTLTEEQLQSLLKYIEVDINDYTRQATAFSLLKAILSKKLESDDLKRIMEKIFDMAITSASEKTRKDCRYMSLQYMLDYPLGKKVLPCMSFFIEQLSYAHVDGRISALETVNLILTDFPLHSIKSNSTLFLIPLTTMLVNDDSSECKNMAAQCIKKLLEKVEHNGRTELFPLLVGWLQCKKLSYKRLGVQLCGLFAEVEREQFETRLTEILPLIIELVAVSTDEEDKSQTDARCSDHLIFHTLNCIQKIFTVSTVIRKEEYSEHLTSLFDKLQRLILHPHSWVRSITDQLYSSLFQAYTTEELQQAVIHRDASVYINSKQKLRDLSADFCSQLQTLNLTEKFGFQVVRNLLHLAKILCTLEDEDSSDEPCDVSLVWMIRRLCREAKRELAHEPLHVERRKCVFTFMAALVQELGKEKIEPLLNIILLPLCREVSDFSRSASDELKKHAQDALNHIKSILGKQEFAERYSKIQISLSKKRATRKKTKAQEALLNPERHALKRIKKQLNKKDSKKRRIQKKKGKKVVKKNKLSDLVIAS